MAAIYTVEIHDQYGRLVTVINNPRKKEFTLYRNKAGSCQFTMDVFDPQATLANLAVNQYDVVFKRYGTAIFAGQISYLRPTINGDNKEVQIIATGYFDLLDQRYITPDYPGFDSLHNQLPFSNIDAGQVAWDVINWTQFPLTNDGGFTVDGGKNVPYQSFIAQGSANVSKAKLLLQANMAADASPITNTSTTGTLALQGVGGTYEELAQAFVATNNLIYQIICEVAITGNPSDNVIFSIVSTKDGTALGSTTVSAASLVGFNSIANPTSQVNTITFATPVVVTPGNTYYLQITRSGADDPSNYIAFYYSTSGSYASGDTWTRSGGTWTDHSGWNLYFKIYSYSIPSTLNLIVTIYNDFNNSPTTPVTHGQISVAASTVITALGTGMGWYEFDFTAPFAVLTSGVRYWVQFSLSTPVAGFSMSWFYQNNSIYPLGRAFTFFNDFTASQNLCFFVQLSDNSYQMMKNTYLGIDQGTIQTSFNVSPVFAQYKKIKSCVEDISNEHNGIDFNISFAIDSNNQLTKKFNIWYPHQGIINTSLPFNYPGNLKKIDAPKNGKTMVNEVTIRGQGNGSAQPTGTSLDAQAVFTYDQRQDVNDQSDVNDSGTLTLLASEYVRLHKDPLALPVIVIDGQFTPQVGSYGIGDTIQFSVTNLGMFNGTYQYRIEAIHVTISEDDMEEVELTLSSA